MHWNRHCMVAHLTWRHNIYLSRYYPLVRYIQIAPPQLCSDFVEYSEFEPEKEP